MVKIIVIGDLADCRKIAASAREILCSGQKCLIAEYCDSLEESWNRLFENPLAYDFAVVELGRDDDSFNLALDRCRRALSVNEKLGIVFMTERTYVPVNIYSASHIDLMRKPLTRNSIVEMLELVAKRAEFCFRNADRLRVYHGKRMQIIHKDSVLYVKKARYGVDLSTETGFVPYDIKIDCFLKDCGNRFLRCHDSFAVNVHHVSTMSSSSIYLFNGEEIPVSRAYKKEVAEYIKKLQNLA
ncbi:MAG: LytTR family transcriptional regulator [Firmicutes bacterium]|nr:LytTR family transcriptional regulator [Bacillota bacterium]